MTQHPGPRVAALLCGALSSLLGAAPASAQEPAPRLDHVWVQGRCTAHESGAPLPGCRVVVTGRQATGYDLGWALLDWFDPAPVVTGADGRFRIRVAWPSGRSPSSGYPCRIHLDITHAERASAFNWVTLPALFDDGGRDCGDVALPRGERPALRIVDEEGRPQANVLVGARHSDLRGHDHDHGKGQQRAPAAASAPARPWLRASGYRYERTGIDGLVRWGAPLQRGSWEIEIRNRTPVEEPTALVVPETKRVLRTLVVKSLAPARTIQGVVVDAAGTPVRDLTLAVRQPGAHAGGDYVRTGSDGTFTCSRADAWKGDTAELVAPLNRRYDGWANFGAFSWGRRDVRIVLPATVELTLQVLAGDRTPITEYAVVLQPGPTRSPIATTLRHRTTAATGEVTLPRVYPGTYTLEVYPRDKAWGPRVLDIEVAAGRPTSLELKLPSSLARTLEVQAGGRPVAGATVELLFRDEDSRTTDPWDRGPVALSGRDANSPVRGPWKADRGRTDAQGRVVLRAPATDKLALVKLRGPGHLSAVVPLRDWRRTLKRVQVLQVAPSARLHGIARPLALIDRLDASDPAKVEQSQRYGRRTNAWRKSVEDTRRGLRPGIVLVIDGKAWEGIFTFDDDGKFDAGDVPPGRCAIHLTTQAGANARGREPVVLAEIDLRAGETKRVELTIPETAR